MQGRSQISSEKWRKTATLSSDSCHFQQNCQFTLGGTWQKSDLGLFKHSYVLLLPCVVWTHSMPAFCSNSRNSLSKMHFPKSLCCWLFLFWVNPPFKPLVYCAPEHQRSTKRQSLCRYLKKSAAADGSPHNEDINTQVCGFYVLFSTSWLFSFFIVNQIRFGMLLVTYLLSGIWLCRCENDGVLRLLILEMWCFGTAVLYNGLIPVLELLF